MFLRDRGGSDGRWRFALRRQVFCTAFGSRAGPKNNQIFSFLTAQLITLCGGIK